MKKVHRSSDAPAPVGPYNQAVSYNGLLFVSGQIALDPRNGEIIQDDISVETRQVMENLSAILEGVNIGFANVLKCTIFVKDIAQYDAINEIYAEYFYKDQAPARELVEVARLPKHANVEISLIAALPEDVETKRKKPYTTYD